jgi:hypothetical protein
MTKTGSISSEKEIVFEKEKFRVLIHKKLVYDSLDDEELVEDVITDNFYFEPNSIIVILTLLALLSEPTHPHMLLLYLGVWTISGEL